MLQDRAEVLGQAAGLLVLLVLFVHFISYMCDQFKVAVFKWRRQSFNRVLFLQPVLTMVEPK